jgi:hypothetical protein
MFVRRRAMSRDTVLIMRLKKPLQEGFGAWIGGVNNRFPVSYADVQPKFVIPIEVNGEQYDQEGSFLKLP